MSEYKQQINYSMPHQCGLYPPPPYIYHNMRAILAVIQCKPGIKEKYLPPEFEPIEYGIDVIFIVEYPESSLGPYNESLILLYCSYKGKPGAFVLNIYVDSEEALTAGREVYGYPKKMCDIKLSPIRNNKIRGTLTRKGITFLDIEVELTNKPPGMSPSDMIANMPLYNLKLIPDVADNSKPVLRQLTETVLSWNVHRQVGANTKYLKTKYSKFDICHEVLKDATFNRGAFYVECDQTLPNGRVL
ncbi:MAG: acetoacetate decarboxylase family protein [Candidatus Helarchaeota archaeon]